MEPDDWPYVVSITCHRHQSRSSAAVSYKGRGSVGSCLHRLSLSLIDKMNWIHFYI